VPTTDVVVIGAGHTGLAMSRRLTERSLDHVVVERGAVAQSWRTERWPGLRLLTPNWQTRLPGGGYDGDDPNGHLSAPEVATLLERYAAAIDAPVQSSTTVTRVTGADNGYRVHTDQGTWAARSVVIASGANSRPNIPASAAGLPPSILQVTTRTYAGPAALPDGGVLIVGAAATGTQIADELARHGRRVVLSVGEHVRMPRDYRGRDIFWWMDASGVLDERYDDVDDVVRARHVPSPQLVGSADRRSIDLASLRALGVELVGRLGAVRDGVALFSGGLANTVTLADLKAERLLDRFDAWAAVRGIADEVDAPHRLDPTTVDSSPRLALDLVTQGISSVIWATGFSAEYPWLDVPVFDHKGRIRHDGGVVSEPGLYLLGASLLRRRRSTYIDGAAADTADLSAHLARYLGASST
jgi:putative flavoprotein involved in K+ transport